MNIDHHIGEVQMGSIDYKNNLYTRNYTLMHAGKSNVYTIFIPNLLNGFY